MCIFVFEIEIKYNFNINPLTRAQNINIMLNNLVSLLNGDFTNNSRFPSFISAHYSKSISREDDSSVEVLNIDINSSVLEEEELLNIFNTVKGDTFIKYFKELGVEGYFFSSKNQLLTQIAVHTKDDEKSDIELYITIVSTDLSYIITVIDPCL